MRTELPAELLATESGARADAILRSCVHCGFCNATCPTYQLLGDELDGPRGRIYLIKEMLEGGPADAVTGRHLDRCLTCRACETTCPSGVAYGELLEIGRGHLERQRPRRGLDGLLRRLLIRVVPNRRRLRPALALGRWFRWLLPGRLAAQVPPRTRLAPEPDEASGPALARRVIMLDGCVQGVATPQVNRALRRLLAARGIDAVALPGEGCCGALALHLGDAEQAREAMRANVRVLAAALVEAEAVISTASGCGVTVKDYGRLLAGDEQAGSARLVADRTVDAAEYLAGLTTSWRRRGDYRRVAWHAPCSPQHGQQLSGPVESILTAAGYELVPVADGHLCCGSAGTYSLLQEKLSQRLRDAKLRALQAETPDVIATANVGCQLHLGAAAEVPVRHWLELIE